MTAFHITRKAPRSHPSVPHTQTRLAEIAARKAQHADTQQATPATVQAPTTAMTTTTALTTTALTMTSKDIAELVGSRHANVKVSIERLAEQGVILKPATQFLEEISNLDLPIKREVYVFSGEQGKRDSIVVVAQLSPAFTAKLVDRWQEKEAAARTVTAPATAMTTADTTSTMSSVEIAELTGKNHFDVVRDLKVLEKQGVINLSKFADLQQISNLDGHPTGTRTIYRLPKRDTLILTSGYSAVQRAAIIDRWLALEEQVRRPALPDFTNPVAAARAWADAQEQAQRLALENQRQQEALGYATPRARTYDAVVAPKHITLRDFIRKLRGVNTIAIWKCLKGLGYVYKTGVIQLPLMADVPLVVDTWNSRNPRHPPEYFGKNF